MMDDEKEGKCARGGADAFRIFHDAFVTELGVELAEGRRLASLRELLDVIICAGKDCLIQVVPRGGGPSSNSAICHRKRYAFGVCQLRGNCVYLDEIFTFEECFQIYQSLPSTSVEELYEVFGAFEIENEPSEAAATAYGAVELDYGTLIQRFQTEGRTDLVKWLRRHFHRRTDIENLIYELVECRKRLRSVNSQIVDEQRVDRNLLMTASSGGGGDQSPAPLVRSISTVEERWQQQQKREGAGLEHKKVSNVSSSGSRHLLPLLHNNHFAMARSESAESLSSLFSNRNSRTMAPTMVVQQQVGDAAGDIVGTFAAGATTAQMAPQQTNNEENRILLKSVVIQREMSETNCIAYAFSLERPRNIRLSICVNEGIDHSLSRFHNSVIGILMSSELESQARIHAVARRKENGKCSTDWVSVPAGSHLVRVRFCRALKIMEPERSDQIVDPKGRLTKSFKCMLMNLFDMFDLDDDGLLSRREFEAYSILSGSGPVSEQEWAKICTNFELRQQHITMKIFIEMHQKESEHYGVRGTMEEMWKAVRALGHNRRFIMSTMCPLRVELFGSEGPFLMEPFRVDCFHADELDPLLAEHFWEQGKPLPYLRDLQTLRQFKTDYYAVLVAGQTQSQMHYMLDLSSSNNVNIEGELVVNQTVPANTLRILSVAIAQAENWFLSVKLAGHKQQNRTNELK